MICYRTHNLSIKHMIALCFTSIQRCVLFQNTHSAGCFTPYSIKFSQFKFIKFSRRHFPFFYLLTFIFLIVGFSFKKKVKNMQKVVFTLLLFIGVAFSYSHKVRLQTLNTIRVLQNNHHKLQSVFSQQSIVSCFSADIPTFEFI